jgi:hypothetical protein
MEIQFDTGSSQRRLAETLGAILLGTLQYLGDPQMKTILTVLLLMVVHPFPSTSQSLKPISISLGGGPTSFDAQRYFEHWKSAFNVCLGLDYAVSNSWTIGADFAFNHATYVVNYGIGSFSYHVPYYGPNLTIFSLSATVTYLILSRDHFVHPYIDVGCGLFRRQLGSIDLPQVGYYGLEVLEPITRIEYDIGLGVEVRVYKSLAAFVKARVTYAPVTYYPFTVGARIEL